MDAGRADDDRAGVVMEDLVLAWWAGPLAIVAGAAVVLTDLGRDPERCHALGLAARSWVETAFSPEQHLRGVRGLYAEAMGTALQPQA